MPWDNYWRKYSGPNYRLYFMIAAIVVLAVIVYFSTYYKPVSPLTTCQNLYWFDNVNRVCGYKQLCGLYMYQGLQTFNTLQECQSALNATTTPTVETGILLIGVKDAKHRLPGGNDIMGLNITITKVEVHKTTGNETDESGWLIIYDGSKTVDLIKYNETVAIIAEKNLETGKYTQIRLYINDSRIKITNIFQQFYNKIYPVVIKNEDKPFKVVHPFSIEAGQTLTLTLDFDVDNSVTKDSEGYKLKPVLGKVGPLGDGVLEEKGKPTNSETIE